MKIKSVFSCVLIVFALIATGCGEVLTDETAATVESTEKEKTATAADIELSEDALSPDSFVYAGAFLMPEDGQSEKQMYSWGGEAIAFCPADDTREESLFVTGHNWYTYVSEISIPEPIVSTDIDELERAEVIQPLSDIKGELFDRWDMEIPRVGLEVLGDKLFFCWGAHNQDVGEIGTHGATSVDLAQSSAEKACAVGAGNYTTNDYIFKIPAEWIEYFPQNCDLLTGRFRDGGLGGRGPSLYAVCSKDIENAGMDEVVDVVPVLQYSSVETEHGSRMDGYSHADSWTGGAFISAEGGSAVVLVGTHGYGQTWYGFANGVEWPTSGDEDEVYPQVPESPYDERGWWNDDFSPSIALYDANALVMAANGQIGCGEVQPYAMIDICEYLLGGKKDTTMHYLGGCAYDEAGGRLFIIELLSDGMQAVHVFKIV